MLALLKNRGWQCAVLFGWVLSHFALTLIFLKFSFGFASARQTFQVAVLEESEAGFKCGTGFGSQFKGGFLAECVNLCGERIKISFIRKNTFNVSSDVKYLKFS
jgi:hypothetical protein